MVHAFAGLLESLAGGDTAWEVRRKRAVAGRSRFVDHSKFCHFLSVPWATSSRVSLHGDFARLGGGKQLPITAFLILQLPTIVMEALEQVTDLHYHRIAVCGSRSLCHTRGVEVHLLCGTFWLVVSGRRPGAGQTRGAMELERYRGQQVTESLVGCLLL